MTAEEQKIWEIELRLNTDDCGTLVEKIWPGDKYWKNPALGYKVMCTVLSPNRVWYCTLESGHEGYHVAHYGGGPIVAMWKEGNKKRVKK